MTTINNLTIEQMREIVEGAPEGATGLIDGCYIKNASNKGDYTYAEVFQDEYVGWKRNARAKTSYFIENVIGLNDLRTAIAKHSREFKVGDFVVLNQSHSQDRVLKIQMFHEDFIRAFVGDSIKYSFGHKTNFRRATPEEIKAGHRLEAERHG